MGSSLVWRPINTSQGYFGTDLKRAIGMYKFGGDGSTWDNNLIFNTDEIDFLKGLAIAGIKEAQELIDLIRIHGEIELFLNY